MSRMTPQQAAEKWASRTASATGDWERGVQNVTQAPGAAAAAAKDKWAAGVAAAKDRFAANSQAVSLTEWKSRAVTKSSRYSQGTEAAKPKMQTFLQTFLPAQEAITNSVRAMPSTTPEQREARMIAQMRQTRALRQQK